MRYLSLLPPKRGGGLFFRTLLRAITGAGPLDHRKVSLRDYEIVYIFHPGLEEAGVNEKLDRFQGLLTGSHGGTIAAVDHWGKRQLAYPIEDQTSGYYVVSHFSAPAETLPEFERILKLDDSLLRYLVVINEGDLATTPVPPQPKRDEESEEGEEE
jgi:small subunit ribosomal protein S6